MLNSHEELSLHHFSPPPLNFDNLIKNYFFEISIVFRQPLYGIASKNLILVHQFQSLHFLLLDDIFNIFLSFEVLLQLGQINRFGHQYCMLFSLLGLVPYNSLLMDANFKVLIASLRFLNLFNW